MREAARDLEAFCLFVWGFYVVFVLWCGVLVVYVVPVGGQEKKKKKKLELSLKCSCL